MPHSTDLSDDCRRCPSHPEVVIGSPCGRFDAVCEKCEMEAHEEGPELGPGFFVDPIVVRPGENLIDKLDEERHDAPANDMKGDAGLNF